MTATTEAEARPDEGEGPGPVRGYAPAAERPPLLSYGVAMGVFNALLAGLLLLARRRGRELPERVAAADLALVGVAGHKLSRLIAKDKVTSPLRAPFTEFEGEGGPFAALSLGLLFAPRLTRFLASLFAALTISDFLQIAYKAAEEKGLGS